MKPKLLKIKGLNSFLDEQRIDFSKLTEKGLFGIFGQTGSGKSSILDAITLALYGEISRASKNDKGYINTNTDNVAVSLEFEIGDGGNRRTYIVERNIARDKHGSYKAKQVRLIEVKGDEKEVIGEKGTDVNNQIQDILGLSLDDFTRSVVLPQGKFSEFLKLTGAERRNMLERIFNLEKYGRELTEKVRKEKFKKISEKDKLVGQLKAYEGVSEEAVKELSTEIEKLTREEEEFKAQRVKKEEEFNKYRKIWDFQTELDKHEKTMRDLEEEKPMYEKNKTAVERGEKANKVKDNIFNLKSTEDKLKENSESLELIGKNIINLEEAIKIHKVRFDNAENEKNIKIPELVKRETELNQVIEIMENIEKLKKERENYKQCWEELKRNVEEKQNEKSNMSQVLEVIKAEILKNESIINENKIEPEFRNKVQLALDVEKEYKTLCKDIEEFTKEIDTKNKFIEEKGRELLLIEGNVRKKTEELNIAEKKLKDLKCPGDSSMVNQKLRAAIEGKNKINTLMEKIDEKKELLKQLDGILNKKTTWVQDEKAIGGKLLDLKEDNQKLKEEIEKIIENNKASILAKGLKEGDTCPVCGSIHHIHLAAEIDNELLDAKEQQYKNAEEDIKKLDNKLTNIQIQVVKITTSEESLIKQLEAYKEIDPNINLTSLLEEANLKEQEAKALEDGVKLYESEKDKINSEKLTLTTELGKLNSDYSSFKSLVEIERKNKVELEEKLQKKQKSQLVKEIEYNSLKEETKVDNLKEKMNEIQQKDKEIQKLEKINAVNKKAKEDKETSLDALSNEINNLNLEIQNVTTLGKAVKEQIDEKINECSKIYKGENPVKDLEILLKNIENINKNYNETKVKYEDTNNKLMEASKKKEAYTSEKLTLEQIKSEQQNSLNAALNENGFNNVDEVIASIIEPEAIDYMLKEIKDYEEKLAITRSNIEAIQGKLNGVRITQEQFKDSEEGFKELQKVLSEKHDLITNKSQCLRDIKKKLEECVTLQKEERKVEDRLGLINQIDRLIQGNRFVEYVAKHQLKYIAREASKRLKNISRDRYGLEIDDEGNFIIVDDYNGGERRSTNTLSGGETFLASLALALALSSQIQLKGSAPLEFFFLDEGFGTLDSELLDIVMSSLERLHNSRLSVGIISHVEELKQRVPVKLIVTSASPGEGGTKVRIDY